MLKSLKYSLLLLSAFIISCSSGGGTGDGGKNNGNQSVTVYDLKYPMAMPMVSGHRGAKNYKESPENCLETFDMIRAKMPCIIECDVASSKDGILLLMHDKEINRTTTGSGRVVDLNGEDILSLNLLDKDGQLSPYKVPSFEEVLDWAIKTETILSVDMKRSVDFEDVVDLVRLKKAEDWVMLISYTLRQASSIYAYAPELMQSVSIRNLEEHHMWKQSKIPSNRTIAFTGTRRSPKELYDKLHADGVACIFGTLGNIDRQAKSKGSIVYEELLNKGVDIIASDRPLEVYEVLEDRQNKGL